MHRTHRNFLAGKSIPQNARIFTKTASGGAAVSAAPINNMVLLTRMVHLYYDGALLALASGKAERRQVHPLNAPPGLLHEQLFYLAVGCAHDVDATLEVLYAYSAEVVYLDVGIVVGSG